jgi:phosphatidylglycerol:prolipoprotein diacylglycerol transferase
MHPLILKIGSFELTSYGLMMVVALCLSTWLALSRAARFGLVKEQIFDISFWAILGGVLGARAFYIVQEWDVYSKDLSQVLTFRFQGLTSFGGLVGGFLGAWVACKLARPKEGQNNIRFIDFLDCAGPAFVLGSAIGRIGCLLNGCCYGPIAQAAFPFLAYSAECQANTAPAPLYDAMMNLGGLAVLVALFKKRTPAGHDFGQSLMIFGVARFIYELWRAGGSSTVIGRTWITEAQVAALIIAVIGLALVLRAQRRAQ